MIAQFSEARALSARFHVGDAPALPGRVRRVRIARQHIQALPAQEWVIRHGFATPPTLELDVDPPNLKPVAVISADGEVMVKFAEPCAGRATLTVFVSGT